MQMIRIVNIYFRFSFTCFATLITYVCDFDTTIIVVSTFSGHNTQGHGSAGITDLLENKDSGECKEEIDATSRHGFV